MIKYTMHYSNINLFQPFEDLLYKIHKLFPMFPEDKHLYLTVYILTKETDSIPIQEYLLEMSQGGVCFFLPSEFDTTTIYVPPIL